MENTAPKTLPGTPPSSNLKDFVSQEVPSEESIAGLARSLPTSLSEDCSSSADMQRLQSSFCPPLKSQIDSTLQEIQYGSQTIKEESLANSQANQIQSPGESVEPVVVAETEKERSIVEYKTETGIHVELGGKEHTGAEILFRPQSQICFTVSSSSVPQSSIGFKIQESGESRVIEQSDMVPLVSTSQCSQKLLSCDAESAGCLQVSESALSLYSTGNTEIKHSDQSKTQPTTIKDISEKANSLESVETFKYAKLQPPSAEMFETSKAAEPSHGLYSSARNKISASTCSPPEAEQVDGNSKDELVDSAPSFFTMLPEFSSTKESSSNPTTGCPLSDTSLLVSLQSGEVVGAETSHIANHSLSTETSLIAKIVHTGDAQEIVVVGEEAHISGDWSNMHLNQNYLLQREDGSVCEAAIVNELSTGEPKLYEESIQAGIELGSQPVEVYELCGLVEEVAEETVCVGSGVPIPHSPGYEVNLFNALLENTDEDFEPTIHTVGENDTIIISQQPLPSSGDDSHNLSIQNAGVAAVGHHLVLNSNQAVEVAHSSEVCLVQVTAVTSDSFTVEQTGTTTQTGTPCSQVSAAQSELMEVSDSAAVQTVYPKQEAEITAGSLSLLSPLVTSVDTGIQSPTAVSLHISCVENQTSGFTVVSAINPDVCPNEGTKVSPPLTQSQSIQNIVVDSKPEVFCTTYSTGVLSPKLLLLKPGEAPLLKHPPSLFAKMSKQPNADSKLTHAHGSLSGTVSEDGLPPTVSTAEPLPAPPSLCSLNDQTQMSVSKMSEVAAPVEVQQLALSGTTSRQFGQTDSVTPTASTVTSEGSPLLNTSSSNEDLTPQTVAVPLETTPVATSHAKDTLMAAEKEEPIVSLSTNPSDSNSYPDDVEEESDDMDQDDPVEEGEVHEDISGQVSSAEEDSDDEPDPDRNEMTTPSSSHKHGQSRTDKQALFLKVRRWIADRVTINSSPASPSTSSSSSLLGPSSTSDWASSRREKSSPLRGPHGQFVSPSSIGYTSSSSSPPDQTNPQRSRGERLTDMAELAKHEADIEHRSQALKREGFWSMKRLTRLTEPPRPKVHWDYLCEEMQWLSADFAQERRWKRGVARKVVRMVMRHHEDLRQKEEKAKRDEHAKIRRVASSIAKEVRAFWSNVEKVVQFKQQSRLEEKRKKALDLQLDFIVGQTEKYSDLLSKSLAPVRPAETTVSPQKSLPPPVDEEDRDFEPLCEEDDDEETIEVEEQQEGNDAESHQREIELLKEEGTLPLDQLLSTLKLPPPEDSGSDDEGSNESSSSSEEEEEDREFTANDEDAEDEEDTIAAQERVEGNVNHAEELDDLAKEGDLSLEELLEKYKGAYASDFEAPSASVSKGSSDSEVSGDEEVENEEDECDVESNSSSSDSAGDSADDETDNDDGECDEEDNECEDEGMELLLKEGGLSPPSSSSRPKKEISHIAATAESLQPKGYTLATTKVKTPIPFLLHGTLREYQHIGLDWLVTMYEKKLNGILADEMGLGKTIQTIALLAHLACEKGNWGPHLIIVPTSVMLNWEMELKRWCPGFKILTYFGSQKERKLKRQGWTKPNAFHVCITSYKLVLQDHQAFRRKSWRYLILDEAQNIKNFKSQRWQSLLNFNSHRRLLLTGTPLQNSLMELWSLMHFLMPHVFQSHREFKEWFSNPLTGMIEGSQEYNEGLVKRLHKVLRPFLLRRIKADVEKQMPKKYEHVVRCRLSKRQRFLYDDFMAQASTRETLASGHFMSVINILMQLRKVCNHPNLFDPRPIQSPFITQPIIFRTASLVQDALDVPPLKRCDLSMFDFVGLESRVSRYQADAFLPRHKVSRQLIQEIVESPEPPPRPKPVRMKVNRTFQPPPKGDNRSVVLMNKPTCSVPPAAQTPKSPPVSEISSAPAPPPAVQQVVCSVASIPPPRLLVNPAPQTAVRSSTPKPVLTVRPPSVPGAASVPAHPSPNPGSIMPQRVLLSPDMQARLPSGEVVSIAQLASLAGRPVSSCQGSKPVTFQLQGNKLTLSGAHIHKVPAAVPRPVQGNVMHLVSSGVQHHLISQPAQLTVQTTTSAHAANTPAASSVNKLPLSASPQVSSSMVSSPGVVKIVVRQSAGKEGGPVPTLAVAPSPRVAPQAPAPSLHPHTNTTPVRNTVPLQIAPRTPGPATAHYTIAPPRHPGSTPNQPQAPRPVLKVVQPPPPSTVQPVPPQAAASVSKSSAAPRDSTSSCQTPVSTKSKPTVRPKPKPPPRRLPRPPPRSPFYVPWLSESLKQQHQSRLDFICQVNERRCGAKPVYGREVLDFLTFLPGPDPSPAMPKVAGEWSRSGHSSCLFTCWQNRNNHWFQSSALSGAINGIEERLELLSEIIDRFVFAIPPVEAPRISMHCCHPSPSLSHKQAVFSSVLSAQVAPLTCSLHRIHCNMRTQFPDLRLIQYDCGKLQTLHTLLRKLKSGGHRVLIFTQMTRMLDVLEQFLNYHGHIYLRLDGSTRVEQRQALMERFNADRRIFCFILSTRSGGVGVNLTGADTVVFYDSDWNPTMDAQAQDRCHRIGQTRDVHIYRLISERTVEENILKKANQKRMLGDMAIEGGNFTTAFFKEQTIRELFDVNDGEKREVAVELSVPQADEEEGVNKQNTTILEQALCRAEDEEDIVAASQAKAEQVAELAEFNENIPLDDGGEQEEVEELSKAEQEIAALVEQLTPIERYAMNFLEASLEDVCKEELKQAEEQVEAARKGLDQAKEEGLLLHPSSDVDDDDFLSIPTSSEPAQPAPARRGRKPKDKTLTSTRTSGRLRGASPETEPEPKEVPERLRSSLRGRGAGAVSTPRTDHKTSSANRVQDSSKPSKGLSPARDQQAIKTRTQPTRSHHSPVPSPSTSVPPAGKQHAGEPDGRNFKTGREEKERRMSESSLDSSCAADHLNKDYDEKEHSSRSPRKRQSADGEVLRGLMDDSPSAKVLRKLPGRLVTVVEEKEPQRRRQRGGGTGGSTEEATMKENVAENAEEPNQDNTPQSPDGKTKVTVDGSPQDQESTPSSAVHPQLVRGYPPYSPPHLSPDMPVLRNLPVRRRLETESRMAAQLGEQQQLSLGRGRGATLSKKVDPSPGKDNSSASTVSSGISSMMPLKRKRGRPPKTPSSVLETDSSVIPSPSLPGEEKNPPLSPKRKRGRPRKDTTATADAVSEAQSSDTKTEQGVPSETQAAHQDAQSTKAGETTNVSSLDPVPAQTSETNLDQTLTPVSAPPCTPPTPQLSSPLPVPAFTTASTSSAPPPGQHTSPLGTLESSVPGSTCPTVTVATSVPPSSSASERQTTVVSTSAAEPDSSSVSVKSTEPESKPATDASPRPAVSPSAEPSTTITATVAPQTQSVHTTEESEHSASSTSLTGSSTTLIGPEVTATTLTPVETTDADPLDNTSVKTEQTSLLNPTVSDEASAAPPEETTATPPEQHETPSAKEQTNRTTVVPASPPPPDTAAEDSSELEKSSVASPAPPSPTTLSVSDAAALPTPTEQVQRASSTSTSTIHTPIAVATSTEAPLTVDATSPPEQPHTKTTNIAATQITAETSEVTCPQEQNPPSTHGSEETSEPAPAEALPSAATPADLSETESIQRVTKHQSEEEMFVDAVEKSNEVAIKPSVFESQTKRRREESLSETKESSKDGEGETKAIHQEVKRENQDQKRPLSRQSSQESVRSSSPSSGSSSSTLTRHAHHKKTYENRHPVKRRRVDVTSEGKTEEKEEDGAKKREGEEMETIPVPSHRKRSRSSSSSSDSDSSESRKRLTRSAKRRLQDEEKEKGNKARKGEKPVRSSDRNASHNTTSTGGESGSDTSSVRIIRKSAGSQSSQDSKSQTNNTPPLPPEPEVLGKRCSALNAAAKLLAMKGRVDTPGHTTRKDPGAKSAASFDKIQKPKHVLPQSNSVNSNNDKSKSIKPSTPEQTSRPAARSTRQCPGALVPPLEIEYKRPKVEDKDSSSKLRGKEAETETRSSSRGHSACSSMSSDGEGDCGGRRSRSRSSSNSSQHTLSLSSQNTERRGSRAASSGSERDRDRSPEHGKSHSKQDKRNQKESRRGQKLSQEVSSSSGTEGTPDRVLRSVAALAAVQARSPAASTRSSSNQQRNKT
nr:helicase SRCAP isoform X1 [Nothobranchius furzeri]